MCVHEVDKMTEDQAKKIYFDIMDIFAIIALNQNNEEFDIEEEFKKKGYTF